MKPKGILFKGEMVRAIRDGRKTQTRRALKTQPRGNEYMGCAEAREYLGPTMMGKWGAYFPDFIPCPYRPGSLLYVKETYRIFDSSSECACYDDCQCSGMHGKPLYRADHDDTEAKWKSSMFMPRALSRITLEVTDARVERLQDISAEDSIAEGVLNVTPLQIVRSSVWKDYSGAGAGFMCPEQSYRSLWESINGLGSWAADPFVWVIDFKRIQP